MRNHRNTSITLPRYVWIVTRATSHADGTETAEVLQQHRSAAKCQAFVDDKANGPNLGYEGPVLRTSYPVGHTFLINDGQVA